MIESVAGVLSELLPPEQAFLILGMALVTYLPRALPLLLLSSRNLSPLLMRWLEMVPPAVLAALLVPELLLESGPEDEKLLTDQIFVQDDPGLFLMAALPTFVVGKISNSFFGTVAFGMGLLAFLRWLL